MRCCVRQSPDFSKKISATVIDFAAGHPAPHLLRSALHKIKIATEARLGNTDSEFLLQYGKREGERKPSQR